MNEVKAKSGKPKKPQAARPDEISLRDLFQTPNYAVDLLVPFLKDVERMSPFSRFEIWECAAGLKKIVNRLGQHGYKVTATDLSWENSFNFLIDRPQFAFNVIVTNPPFSVKSWFFKKCISYKKPFALLIPADYTGWVIDAVKTFGCEKVVPTRRIDYITPNILKRIWEGETWEIIKKEKDLDSPLITREMYIDSYPMEWQWSMVENEKFKFDTIYDAPAELLRKYSSSYYHSMWLTWGFNIGRTETFVELSNEDKFNI